MLLHTVFIHHTYHSYRTWLFLKNSIPDPAPGPKNVTGLRLRAHLWYLLPVCYVLLKKMHPFNPYFTFCLIFIKNK